MSTIVEGNLSFGLSIAPASPVIQPTPTRVRLARVLHIINGEHFSGAERVQQLLGKNLPEFGFAPQFACVKPGKFRECCGLDQSIVHETPMNGRFDLKVAKTLIRKVQKDRIELVHAHTPRSSLIAARVARHTGIPWIYHVHSPTAQDSTRKWINRINDWVERWSIRYCNCMITVSRSLRHEMLSRGVPRQRLVCIPNGVAPIEPIVPAERLSQSDWKLGIVALMRPRKGIEIALESVAALRRAGKQVTLDLIGGFETDAYRHQILCQIEALNIGNLVRWTGFTNDVPSAVRRLDALVLPSLFGEGMPMVVLEALAAGVPVIATRVEGTPEVIRDGVEGLLANANDSADFAQKIDCLISNRQRWSQMSARALARHRSRFSDIEMTRRTARVYRRVIFSHLPPISS